jgi:hypothetical protein
MRATIGMLVSQAQANEIQLFYCYFACSAPL